jgi:hypothetical protein
METHWVIEIRLVCVKASPPDTCVPAPVQLSIAILTITALDKGLDNPRGQGVEEAD